MGLETGVNYIDDLNENNPVGSDAPSTLDNHDRLIKTAVKGSFPSLGSTAVTATAAELNILDGVTKTTVELNNAPQLEQDTAVTVSGSAAYDVSTVPSWAKRVVITLREVSPASAANILMQLRTSAGLDNTANYRYTYANLDNATAISQSSATSSAQFGSMTPSTGSTAASGSIDGVIELINLTGNTWVLNSQLSDCATTFGGAMRIMHGSKSLTGTLTGFSLYLSSGNYDAGTINTIWYG